MSVVFAAVWSVLLLVGCRSLIGRLLGVRVTVPASLIAGGMGIAVAAVSASWFGPASSISTTRQALKRSGR